MIAVAQKICHFYYHSIQKFMNQQSILSRGYKRILLNPLQIQKSIMNQNDINYSNTHDSAIININSDSPLQINESYTFDKSYQHSLESSPRKKKTVLKSNKFKISREKSRHAENNKNLLEPISEPNRFTSPEDKKHQHSAINPKMKNHFEKEKIFKTLSSKPSSSITSPYKINSREQSAVKKIQAKTKKQKTHFVNELEERIKCELARLDYFENISSAVLTRRKQIQKNLFINQAIEASIDK